MNTARALAFASLLVTALAASAGASEILAEHVTGGQLDLPWVGGFATPNSMYGKTLDASNPAYANPSGDHTVAVAQTTSPDSGGIIVTTTAPGVVMKDYAWEGWIFTGQGDSRRGIILRADPGNDFESFYMFVIEQGLFKLRFRKLVNGAPTTLQEWLVTALPAGSIPQNSWHKLKVIATGATFRCFFDDFELTTTPIEDHDIAGGWVGCYNFRFDAGNIAVYYDDLVLSCVHEASVALDVKPHDLNLASHGKWVTAFVTPEPPASPSDIGVATLRLNGVPASVETAKIEGGRLKVKFDRQAFAATLTAGDAVTVTLTGQDADGCITGTDEIKVKAPKLHAPHAGERLIAGQAVDVTWDVDPDASAMTLMLSTDNGATWVPEAENVANTGTLRWTVPSTVTENARLELVSVYDTDETGPINQSEYAESDAFAISSTLGVDGGTAAFSLRVPNPVASELTVRLSLPNASPAQLAVYDVAGRALLSRSVSGIGSQGVSLGRLPAGLYMVRLSQEGRSVTSRVAVVN